MSYRLIHLGGPLSYFIIEETEEESQEYPNYMSPHVSYSFVSYSENFQVCKKFEMIQLSNIYHLAYFCFFILSSLNVNTLLHSGSGFLFIFPVTFVYYLCVCICVTVYVWKYTYNCGNWFALLSYVLGI